MKPKQLVLFEEPKAEARRTLAKTLNDALHKATNGRKSKKKQLPPIPLITVPGLCPYTGRKLK